MYKKSKIFSFLVIIILTFSLASLIGCNNKSGTSSVSNIDAPTVVDNAPSIDGSNPVSGTGGDTGPMNVAGIITGTVYSNGQFTGVATINVNGAPLSDIYGNQITATVSGTGTGNIAGEISGSYTGVVENGVFTSLNASATSTTNQAGSISATFTVFTPSITGTTNISVTTTQPDSVALNGSFTATVSSDGSFSGTFTAGDGTTGTISGTVTGDVTGTITGTVSGTVNSSGDFSGTISGTFVGTGSGTISGTIVCGSINTSISGTLNGDGTTPPAEEPGSGTPIVISDVSDGGASIGYGSTELPSTIDSAIDNAINNGQNVILYWASNYKWQPKKYFGFTYYNPPVAEYRGEHRAIVIFHKDVNTVSITYGWFNPSTKVIIPEVSIGNTAVFTAGDQYNLDYSKNDSGKTRLKYHAGQFYWWCGIVYN